MAAICLYRLYQLQERHSDLRSYRDLIRVGLELLKYLPVTWLKSIVTVHRITDSVDVFVFLFDVLRLKIMKSYT